MPRAGSDFFSRLKEALPPGVAVVMVSAALVWAAQEASEKREAFSYDPAGHRDPFVPLVRDGRLVGVAPPGAKGTDKPVLYGILWDPGGQSIALINDGEVKVGDTIAGYRVQEIRQDAVVLTSGGVPVVLEIAFDTPPSTLAPGATTGGEGR
jgi:hypothetical protein